MLKLAVSFSDSLFVPIIWNSCCEQALRVPLWAWRSCSTSWAQDEALWELEEQQRVCGSQALPLHSSSLMQLGLFQHCSFSTFCHCRCRSITAVWKCETQVVAGKMRRKTASVHLSIHPSASLNNSKYPSEWKWKYTQTKMIHGACAFILSPCIIL